MPTQPNEPISSNNRRRQGGGGTGSCDRPRPSSDDQRRHGGGQASVCNWPVGADKGLTGTEIDRWRAGVDQAFRRLSRVPRPQLLWMTIIGSAIVVTAGDHSEIVKSAISDLETKVRSRCRRKLSGMRIRGVHEIDILAPTTHHLGAHKRATLERLSVTIGDIRRDERVLLVHLHCVIDIGHHRAEKVRAEFAAEFSGPWRTLGKPINGDGSVADNVSRLSSYSSKLKVAYADAWAGRRTKFGSLYEPEWIQTFRSTVAGIGLDALTFQHGDLSKLCDGGFASSEPNELDADHADPAVVAQISGGADCLQLLRRKLAQFCGSTEDADASGHVIAGSTTDTSTASGNCASHADPVSNPFRELLVPITHSVGSRSPNAGSFASKAPAVPIGGVMGDQRKFGCEHPPLRFERQKAALNLVDADVCTPLNLSTVLAQTIPKRAPASCRSARRFAHIDQSAFPIESIDTTGLRTDALLKRKAGQALKLLDHLLFDGAVKVEGKLVRGRIYRHRQIVNYDGCRVTTLAFERRTSDRRIADQLYERRASLPPPRAPPARCSGETPVLMCHPCSVLAAALP